METLEHGYRRHGSRPGYNTIVGTGLNGTVLHYMSNEATIGEDDLIVIDSGGLRLHRRRHAIPAGGKFGPRRARSTTVLSGGGRSRPRSREPPSRRSTRRHGT